MKPPSTFQPPPPEAEVTIEVKELPSEDEYDEPEDYNEANSDASRKTHEIIDNASLTRVNVCVYTKP